MFFFFWLVGLYLEFLCVYLYTLTYTSTSHSRCLVTFHMSEEIKVTARSGSRSRSRSARWSWLPLVIWLFWAPGGIGTWKNWCCKLAKLQLGAYEHFRRFGRRKAVVSGCFFFFFGSFGWHLEPVARVHVVRQLYSGEQSAQRRARRFRVSKIWVSQLAKTWSFHGGFIFWWLLWLFFSVFAAFCALNSFILFIVSGGISEPNSFILDRFLSVFFDAFRSCVVLMFAAFLEPEGVTLTDFASDLLHFWS